MIIFLGNGDLNSEISDMVIYEFYETDNLQNIIKDPTRLSEANIYCFENTLP